MTLNWRQAMTTLIVGFVVGALVGALFHGSFSQIDWGLVMTVAGALAASRLVETKKL